MPIISGGLATVDEISHKRDYTSERTKTQSEQRRLLRNSWHSLIDDGRSQGNIEYDKTVSLSRSVPSTTRAKPLDMHVGQRVCGDAGAAGGAAHLAPLSSSYPTIRPRPRPRPPQTSPAITAPVAFTTGGDSSTSTHLTNNGQHYPSNSAGAAQGSSRTSTEFKCAICDEEFTSAKMMEAHAKLKSHQAFQCSKCVESREFSRIDAYRHHLSKHIASKQYSCQYCTVFPPTNRSDTFDKHMERCHPGQHRKMKIKHCPHTGCPYSKHGHQLPSRKAYDSHMAQAHGLGKTDCIVSPCTHVGNKGFTRDRDLISHVPDLLIIVASLYISFSDLECIFASDYLCHSRWTRHHPIFETLERLPQYATRCGYR